MTNCKLYLSLLLALLMCGATLAQGPAGELREAGAEGAPSVNVTNYNLFVYQDTCASLKLTDRWEEQVEGLRGRGSRGFLDDLFSVTKSSATGLLSTGITGLVSTGVNFVGNLVNYKKNKKNQWKQAMLKENRFEKTLFMLENLDDFYSSISTTGALDPGSMSFNGFGCLQTRGRDTVLYISCRLDTSEVALSRILRHSKFQLRLDTLVFNPILCDLPNDSTVSFADRHQFSFSERTNLRLRIDLDVTSSWINQAIQVYNDHPLGNFYIDLPIKEDELDADTVFRYYASQGDRPGCEVVGDCFIVPRSYIGVRDAEGNFHDAWGTGQYKMSMTIRETCDINPAFERDDDLWNVDWKRRKRARPQTFDIVQVARQVWDKNANRWIVTLLEAPAQYATQEVLQTLGLAAGKSAQASGQAKAAAGAMPK